MRIFQIIFYMVLVCWLSACSTGEDVYAPVVDVETIEAIPKKGVYRVAPGETLYSIAWRYGLDYRSLAQRNRLSPPYTIRVGQSIYLRGRSPIRSASNLPKQSDSIQAIERVEREPTASIGVWEWPARGPVIGEFSGLNKGINIGGHLGDPVYATAAGKVVYSGNGLRSYGNLIIIKHNSTFLTAYAHNKISYVKAGDWVNSGQKIGEMGKTGTQRVMLHFEIRHNGRPENPLIYLAGRS